MSNGIDFVIGGKDRARQAFESAGKSLRRLEVGVDRLNKAGKRLKAMFLPLISAMTAFKGLKSAVAMINEANAAYDRQAKSVKDLETALRMHGAAVEQESARLQEFANSVRIATGVTDDQTMALLKQASMMKINTGQIDQATKAAIGLSEATGKSLDESLVLVRNSLAGQFQEMERLYPQMRGMISLQEKLAFVTEIAQQGFDKKANSTTSVSSAAARATSAMQKLSASVGHLFAPLRVLVSQGLATLAESLNTLIVPAVEMAKKALANIGPVMEWVRKKVIAGVNAMIAAFTAFEVVVMNLDQVWVAVVAQTELYVLQISGAIQHAFTEVIPAYASWFARNFTAIISDTFRAVVQIFQDAGKIIGESAFQIFDFIRSGMQGGVGQLMADLAQTASQGILTGFETTVEALPDIAARKISEREKDLASVVGQVGANIGGEFARKFNERMIGFGNNVRDEIGDINLQFDRGVMNDLRKFGTQPTQLNVSESRLLTMGPGSQKKTMEDLWQVMNQIAQSTKTTAVSTGSSESELKNQTAIMQQQPQLAVVGVP